MRPLADRNYRKRLVFPVPVPYTHLAMEWGKLKWVGVVGLMILMATVEGAQGTKAKANPKPSPKSAQAASQIEAPVPLEFGDNGPDFDMPTNWPAPGARPSGSPEAAAAALARSVLKGGPDALPAIQRAALESGISIRNESGEVIFAAPESADIGLSVSDFELAVAAFATHRNATMEFAELNKVYASDERLASMDLRSLLEKTLNQFQGSIHPGKRFWAQFVRSFGLTPGSPYSFLFEKEEGASICSAQLVWLSYVGAGQMHAAFRRNPHENLLTALGPFRFERQRPSQMAAMRNLQRIVQHLGQGPIAQHIQTTVSGGNDPAWAMLELAASELIRTGTRITGTLRNSPLVRTKTRGQTGGDSTLEVRIDFQLSSAARARFARNAQSLGATVPLPPNGPLECGTLAANLLGNSLVHIANVPQWMTAISPGRYRIVLRGDAQHEGFTANAKPVMREASISVNGNHSSLVVGYQPQRTFRIPVRDWLQPGVLLHFELEVTGSGTEEMLSGGSVSWYMIRSLSGITKLTLKMPGATLPDMSGRFDPNGTGYVSWMQNPEEEGLLLDYKIYDFFNYRTPGSGCGEETPTFDSTFRSIESYHDPLFLVEAGKYISSAQFQVNERLQRFSVQFASDIMAPVKTRATNAPVNQSSKAIFSDIEVDAQDLALLKMRWPGGFYDWPAPPTRSGSGSPTYTAQFTARARFIPMDPPTKRSLTVTGKITVTVEGGSGPPSDPQLRQIASSLFAGYGDWRRTGAIQSDLRP